MFLKTGFYNWHEFGLKDSFYPEDMPEEWRLTFYANELECTQVSLSALSQLDDVDELFEDINDQFHIILDCDEIKYGSLIKDLIEQEGVNITAVFCSKQNYQACSELLAANPSVCCIESNKQKLLLSNKLVGQKIIQDQLSIIYVDELLDLKQMRILIEQWIEGSQHDKYYLLLNPAIFKSSFAAEIRLLIDMMGY